jgi:hypothetical protein
VIDCRNDPYYITDIGYCNCYNYTSKSQNKDVIYKGNYCQYNDNDNCFGIGIVDDKGICDFSSIDIRKFSEISNINDLNDGDYVILEYLNTDFIYDNSTLLLNSYTESGKYISYDENPLQKKLDILNYITSNNGPFPESIIELNTLLNPLTVSNKNLIVFQVNNSSDNSKTLKILGTNNYLTRSVFFYGYGNYDNIKSYDSTGYFIQQKIKNISGITDYYPLKLSNPNNININNIFIIGVLFPLSYNKNLDGIVQNFSLDLFNSIFWKILKYNK